MAEKNFEQYQPKVCDTAPEPPPLKKLCNPCTPNKSFIPPDWRKQIDEPFLNEAECEYQIGVTINRDGDSFTAAEFRNSIGEGKRYSTREQFLFSFVQPAIVLILEELDKLVANQIICASHDGPTVSGLMSNELIAKYGTFEGVFMDLKDDPVAKMSSCPDIFRAVKTERVHDPEQPMDMAQFVLRNRRAEVKNPFALELYARAIDFDIDPMQNLVKVLVTVPSFIIDQVPNNPTAEDILEEASRTVDEVVLEVPKLFGQITRLRTALLSYSKFQSYFYQSQDGFMVFKDSKKDYYCSSYSTKVKSFYGDLKELGKKKKWNFRSIAPSLIRKNADKIRITFETKGDNPYSIKKIEAKIEGCDYVKVADSRNRLLKKWSKDPTTMNYIAKISEIDMALRARESYPWLDFLMKFTYPRLSVNYGLLNEASVRDSLGDCIANNAQEFGGELRDYVLTEALGLMDSLAYEFNSKNNCAKLLDDNAIEKKYFEKDLTVGLDARREVRDNLSSGDEEKLSSFKERKASLEEKIKILKEQEYTLTTRRRELIDKRPDTTMDEEIEIDQLDNELSYVSPNLDAARQELQGLDRKSARQERREVKTSLKADQRLAAQKARKKNHPYFKEAKKLALEEIKTQDTLLGQLVDLETFMTTGELNFKKAKETDKEGLLKRMSLCNVKSLTVAALRCLFSGVSQEAAFKKIVESAMRAMDIDVFGVFIQNLPPDEQAKIRRLIEKEWGQMPMPWDEDFKGGSTEEANPYLNYVGTNMSNQGVLAKRAEIEKQVAEINEAVTKKQNEIAAKEALNDQTRDVVEEFGQEIADLVAESGSADEDIFQTNKEIEALEIERSNLLKQIEDLSKEHDQFPVSFKYKEDGTTEEVVQPFSSLPEKRQKELIAAQTGAQGTFGAAAGNIQQAIVEAWIRHIMDIMQIDQLMSILDRFPGGQLVQRYINKVNCTYQGLFNPPLKSFLSTLSFDPCGEGNTGLSFPTRGKLPKLPKLWNKSFLIILRNKFIEKLETVVTQIILKMILKLIQIIDDALCKSLNAVGQFAAQLLTGGGQAGLDEAFRDAFCPDADEQDLKDVKQNALNNALGRGGSGPLQSGANYDCLFEALNGILSKQEVVNLMTNTPSNMDSHVLQRVSEVVKARCPEFADVFGEPDDIADAFGSIGNLIPPELRNLLRDEANAQPEGPIFDSICLTQEELDKWNEDRMRIYTSNGLDEETAQELIDKANDRALNDLGTVSDMLQKGPEGLLEEALADVLSQGDPGCATDPSAVVLEDEDLAADKLDKLNDFFKNIERKFLDDLLGERNALLSNILIDTYGFRFKRHERRNNLPFIFPNFVDSDEQWETRKENFPFQVEVPILGGFPYNENLKEGMFPETVGGALLREMKSLSATYDSSETKTVRLDFIDSKEDPQYESTVALRVKKRQDPTTNVTVDETFHRKISKAEAKKLDIDRKLFGGKINSLDSTDVDASNYKFEALTNKIDYDRYRDRYGIETVLFRDLLSKKANVAIRNSSLSKLQSATDKWNTKVLKFVKKAVTETPSGDTPVGFLFGADEQQKIKFEDMLYVNPEADPNDKKTWVYTKNPFDKVLGKSATEHPRVHFLDPAVHGGNYLFPKIYIEPATYNGWLGMMKTFIPEVEVCDDVDNGFLQINQISRRSKQVENNLPMDKRLSFAPECRFELPYDRQLTPANHGLLEGIVMATVRTYTTDYIIRTMPVLGSIEFRNENYDDSLFLTMAQKMEQEFNVYKRDINIIKGYTYYLLFLEQAVQVVQRQIKDGLIEETPELKAAARKIAAVQGSFREFNIKDDVVLDEIKKGSAIAGYNTEWEEKYLMDGLGAKIVRFLRFLSPFKLSLSRKLAVIHDSKEHAQVFLSALFRKEVESLSSRLGLNMRPRPHVYDLKKYLISKNGVLEFSDIRSGEAAIEEEVIEGGSKPAYGTVRNCPNNGLIPRVDSVPEEGLMFIEKYLRIINKDGSQEVMTIAEFKRKLEADTSIDKNLKISDYFGNATLLNNRFIGTVGVKFGVRLIYVPSPSLGIVTNLDETKERVGKIGNHHHIPLASFEHDVLDKPIRDIDFDDENMGEDLKCFIDGLVETDEFKMMFEVILKSTSFSSLFAIYSFYNFYESIGVDEVEEDRQDNVGKKWKRVVFDDTKRLLKRQFRSIYRLDDDDIKEDSRREKRQFDAQFVSNLLPNAYIGLDSSVMWWQSWRIVDTKPFDSEGEECLNDFQKLFRS